MISSPTTYNKPPAGPVPEFIRLPNPGTRCPYCGLSRTAMYRLCTEGSVRSKTLRKPGQLRGVRLIVYSSLMEYLSGCPDACGETGGHHE